MLTVIKQQTVFIKESLDMSNKENVNETVEEDVLPLIYSALDASSAGIIITDNRRIVLSSKGSIKTGSCWRLMTLHSAAQSRKERTIFYP